MKTLSVVILILSASALTNAQTTPLNQRLMGYCDGFPSAPGQPFILYGIGEREPATYVTGQEWTRCSYPLGGPDVWLGELLRSVSSLQTTTVGLYVKQARLSTSAMGGTVRLWVNSKGAGAPTQTTVSCTLTPASADLYTCNSTGQSVTLHTGDRIISVVTPPAGQTISPVSAMVELNGFGDGSYALSGYCNSVSDPGNSYVLFGLGQRTSPGCSYLPGTPVASSLGEAFVPPGPANATWTLKRLFSKQQTIGGAGTLGGTVKAWINPKSGGLPVPTPITCSLAASQGGLYACSDTTHSYVVNVGDRVIVIVTPSGGNTSLAPVAATIEVECGGCN